MTPEAPVTREVSADFYRQNFPDFWAYVGGEPYAAYETYALPEKSIASVRTAAAAAWRVFHAVAPIMRGLPAETLKAIGIPARALDVCRYVESPDAAESLIARFDFALTVDGPKILEINAETPMFLWESFEIAGAAVESIGGVDVNAGSLAQLERTLRQAVGTGTSRVAVTGYNTWREDWFTAAWAARVAARRSGAALMLCPCTSCELPAAGYAMEKVTQSTWYGACIRSSTSRQTRAAQRCSRLSNAAPFV